MFTFLIVFFTAIQTNLKFNKINRNTMTDVKKYKEVDLYDLIGVSNDATESGVSLNNLKIYKIS